jgi:hypothetical protein
MLYGMKPIRMSDQISLENAPPTNIFVCSQGLCPCGFSLYPTVSPKHTSAEAQPLRALVRARFTFWDSLKIPDTPMRA